MTPAEHKGDPFAAFPMVAASTERVLRSGSNYTGPIGRGYRPGRIVDLDAPVNRHDRRYAAREAKRQRARDRRNGGAK